MSGRKGVILDGWTTNPGDLSWGALEALCELTVYDRTAPEEAAERIRDADAVFLNKARLTGEAMRGAEKLKYVGILATGYNTIDLSDAHELGITVCNAPGYSTMSVAQQAWALLLELTNRTGLHSDDARSGGWSRHPDYCRALTPLTELDGMTLGIVGTGAIGSAVARMGRAFGMRVLGTRRTPSKGMPEGVEAADLERVLRESDVVSLHCPLTEETRGLIDAERLATMKRGAILVNTSRGPLLDEAAVAAALRSGQLGGLGVDVLSVEPPKEGNVLLEAPNCVVTPHIAWATGAARRRLVDLAAENYGAFLGGKAQNVV